MSQIGIDLTIAGVIALAVILVSALRQRHLDRKAKS